MPGKRRTPEQRAANAAYTRDYYWENRDEIRRKAMERHERLKNNPEYVAQRSRYSRATHIRSRYGLELEEYEAMVESQGGLCALCGRPPSGRPPTNRLYVDHDHETGKVRALLCHPCNSAIGKLQDDPDLISRAAQYVYMHKPLVAVV